MRKTVRSTVMSTDCWKKTASCANDWRNMKSRPKTPAIAVRLRQKSQWNRRLSGVPSRCAKSSASMLVVRKGTRVLRKRWSPILMRYSMCSRNIADRVAATCRTSKASMIMWHRKLTCHPTENADSTKRSVLAATAIVAMNRAAKEETPSLSVGIFEPSLRILT